MTNNDQNAFATLNARENENVHHINPIVTMDGTGPDAMLTIALPVAEIAKSKKGPKGRGALGFVCGPIDFEIDSKKYRVYPGWTTLTRR